MTTQTLEKSIKKLSREVASLRAFVIDSIINEDDEGEYKESFVKRVLAAEKEKPIFEYKSKGSLLRHIREV